MCCDMFRGVVAAKTLRIIKMNFYINHGMCLNVNNRKMSNKDFKTKTYSRHDFFF